MRIAGAIVSLVSPQHPAAYHVQTELFNGHMIVSTLAPFLFNSVSVKYKIMLAVHAAEARPRLAGWNTAWCHHPDFKRSRGLWRIVGQKCVLACMVMGQVGYAEGHALHACITGGVSYVMIVQ